MPADSTQPWPRLDRLVIVIYSVRVCVPVDAGRRWCVYCAVCTVQRSSSSRSSSPSQRHWQPAMTSRPASTPSITRSAPPSRHSLAGSDASTSPTPETLNFCHQCTRLLLDKVHRFRFYSPRLTASAVLKHLMLHEKSRYWKKNIFYTTARDIAYTCSSTEM